ncbi:MAG: SseB family protein [Nitriliruptoraceae bacterium]|nr:SseB family protein [Nitriliruptoraceae bacterium]
MPAPRSVPTGSTIRFGPPRHPLDAGALEALRAVVATRPSVHAAYHAGIDILPRDTEDPVTATPVGSTDLIGLDIEDASGDATALIAAVSDALAPRLPTDVEVSVTVLSAEARTTMLRLGGPIGAGGELEAAAARALHEPDATATLVEVLLEATLLVPTAASADAAGTPEPGPSAPTPIDEGEQVQAPLMDLGGRPTIAAYTSLAAVAHADPAAADLRLVPAATLFANWPDEVAFALDLGTRHALLLAPEEVARLRDAVR